MKSNGLLKWLMIPMVLLLVVVGIRLFSGDHARPPASGTAASQLTPDEMKALGIEGDTPRDTVTHAASARVVPLDAPAQLEASLSATLPADASAAAAMVQQRLQQHPDWQHAIAVAYQGVVDAWSLGIAKVPAIVVDRRYVVYGDTDVAQATARITAYRSTHP